MMPWNRSLTNIDITYIISQTPIQKIFRGTFSRNELLKLQPRKSNEAGVINLSKSHEDGTHWTAWFKHPRKIVCYYDSFGDLPPPPEFIKYMSGYKIYYNIDHDQQFNSVICGQLSIYFSTL